MTVKALWGKALMAFCPFCLVIQTRGFCIKSIYHRLISIWWKIAVSDAVVFVATSFNAFWWFLLRVIGAELRGLAHSRHLEQLQVFLYLMPDKFLSLVMAILHTFDTIYQFTVKALCSVALMLSCWYGLMMVSVLFQRWETHQQNAVFRVKTAIPRRGGCKWRRRKIALSCRSGGQLKKEPSGSRWGWQISGFSHVRNHAIFWVLEQICNKRAVKCYKI